MSKRDIKHEIDMAETRAKYAIREREEAHVSTIKEEIDSLKTKAMGQIRAALKKLNVDTSDEGEPVQFGGEGPYRRAFIVTKGTMLQNYRNLQRKIETLRTEKNRQIGCVAAEARTLSRSITLADRVGPDLRKKVADFIERCDKIAAVKEGG